MGKRDKSESFGINSTTGVLYRWECSCWEKLFPHHSIIFSFMIPGNY